MSERNLLDDCVHCGFCLPTCPTYASWGRETDSPRGRIDLMRSLADGRVALDDEVVSHFDSCLGCMACVTSCPSGVKYDVLIHDVRARIEKEVKRPASERFGRSVIFSLFPHPGRLRALLPLLLVYGKSGLSTLLLRSGLLRLLPRWAAAMTQLLPPVGAKHLTAALPPRTEAKGERRLRVGLVAGCVQRVFFPDVNAATVRVLSAEGCDVVVPAGQGCCGALSVHAGREEESLAMARSLIRAFEGEELDVVVTNAAGCGSVLKEYGRLLAHDPEWAARAAAFAAKVRDVMELLDSLPPRAPRNPLPYRVAFHDACHVAHAQRLREEPRRVLRGIPALTLVEIADGEQCCGSAGIHNLVEPESAAEIGERKADRVLEAGADLLASANPGCTLQIQKVLRGRGIELEALHPVQILDAAISPQKRGGERIRP